MADALTGAQLTAVLFVYIKITLNSVYDASHDYASLSTAFSASVRSIICLLNNFPPSWCISTVVPILKPGKEETDPGSYRPISLTSCLCKIMERIINDRLIWYLEKSKLITPVQCGFRKHRSTTDHLVRLESFVREAFIQRQHAVAIFFDLEKAYDTTWKYLEFSASDSAPDTGAL